MKTFIFLIIAWAGVLLSVPLTILAIAWQAAHENLNEIKKHLENNKE